jgi:hypothetical protein
VKAQRFRPGPAHIFDIRPLSQPTSIRKTPVFSSEKAEKRGGDPVGSSTSFEAFAAGKTGVLAGGGLGKRSIIFQTVAF